MALATPIVQNNGAKQPHCSGAAWGSPVKPRAAWGPVMKNTRAMKHTGDETHARAVKSHQPSGLAWFRVVLILVFIPSSFQPFGFQPSGEGFTPPPTPSPGPQTRGVTGSWVVLLRLFGHLVALRFFDAVFERSWLDFASHLGSQNPPKSMKNRCQVAFPS